MSSAQKVSPSKTGLESVTDTVGRWASKEKDDATLAEGLAAGRWGIGLERMHIDGSTVVMVNGD